MSLCISYMFNLQAKYINIMCYSTIFPNFNSAMFNTIQSMWYVQPVSKKTSAQVMNSGSRESIYCIVNKYKLH